MFDLVEGTYATGQGAFRVGRDFTPEHHRSSALESDDESPTTSISPIIDPQLLVSKNLDF